MKLFLKQFFILFIYGLLITLSILAFTFTIFPLDNWTLLYQAKLFSLAYPVIIIALIAVVALLMAIITTLTWRQYAVYTEKQLERLLHDEQLLSENYKELKKIDAYIHELQTKNQHQIEHAQQLATKNATEREQSLQEVVIQERSRLARDLHDSVSQQLFAASMMMSAINEANELADKGVSQQLKTVEEMIQQSQLEMRALLLHLRPVALKGKSLQEGINQFLQELEERIPIELTENIETFSVEKGIEDQLFRVLQEALSNALRHAEPKIISITLIKRDHFIILRIHDDGKGFDLDEVQPGSYGLESMRERARDLGGSCKIVTLPQKGTRVEIKVPVQGS